MMTVLAALGLCCASGLFAYHITKSYQWVEFDGTYIRGKRFWTRRLVENTLDDVRDTRVMTKVVRNIYTITADAILGSVRGWEIRFYHGSSIYLIRYDMKNTEQLVAAIEHALAHRRHDY